MAKGNSVPRETVSEREERILSFWQEQRIFEKSERGISVGFFRRLWRRLFATGRFVFYDGPPFATGLPHYGHILVSAAKDAIARYRTMRGYRVRRRWGWDCHGLPLEVEMEKEIGVETKRGIEEYGVGPFNDRIREVIFKYADAWKKIIPRIGRWVDMENDYRTMQTSYMESVWSVFHRLYRRGFVSNGFKTLFLCPRCSTVVSNSEAAEAYETLTDTAVYVAFPLKDDSGISLVAWTTTPWTLFGNVALGVASDMEYVVVSHEGRKYALHRHALHLFEGAEVVDTLPGSSFVGKEYIPPFDHLYVNDSDSVKSVLWRVQSVSYVDPSVGTGVVHLAPAYGAEDMEVAEELGLPIRHHVSEDGVFVPQLGEFAGLRPKEAGNPNATDARILAALKQKGILVNDESVEHSYPLCWRCSTPLLHYATHSWLVHAERFRDSMVSENQKVRWVPEHMRDGRFGNWLLHAREWAVSRRRFWGTPLPVWRVEKTGEHLIVDSLSDMFDRMRAKNRYTFVRHGHSVSNEMRVLNCREESGSGLTERGREQVDFLAKKLSPRKPTVIFCSPLSRARETADILSKATGADVIEDPLLTELQVPDLHGKSLGALYEAVEESGAYRNAHAKIAGGESYFDVYMRILRFLEKVDAQYDDADIVVVTHRVVVANAKAISFTREGFERSFFSKTLSPIRNASMHEVVYKHMARTDDGDVDIHRPHIDAVVLYDRAGNPAHHVKEVFDCWFESGAMPYGSSHYPFGDTALFNPKRNRGFPADFVCEALDQTRGWFYSLLAIGVGAFGKSPYRQVVVTGIIRAADGKKMSKRLKNYTDPLALVDRYGADSLRHYLLGSPLMRAENLDFKDEQVDEVYKKVYSRLHNCLHFYTTYAHLPHRRWSRDLLDVYIRSRLAETRNAISSGLDRYRLDEAVAPIASFVDDLSTWYIRRSRDRMRYDTLDGAHARETLRFVLTEFSKCLAPIAPFYAEHLFGEMRKYHPRSSFLPESVHLCPWVERLPVRQSALDRIASARLVASLAHEQRSVAGIKVRQPLQRLVVRDSMDVSVRRLVAEEVNVKEVVVDPDADDLVFLDTSLTPDLLAEGFVREYIRHIQTLRKSAGFSLTETLDSMQVDLPEEQEQYLRQFEDRIKRETRVSQVVYGRVSGEAQDFTISDVAVSVSLAEQPGKLFS